MHVHVRRADGEAVFLMGNEIELRESAGMKVKELAEAEALATENRQLIIEKWHEHLGEI